MTKYLDKSFTVPFTSEEYRSNYDQVFGAAKAPDGVDWSKAEVVMRKTLEVPGARRIEAAPGEPEAQDPESDLADRIACQVHYLCDVARDKYCDYEDVAEEINKLAVLIRQALAARNER